MKTPKPDWSNIKRPHYHIPADVREAIESRGLMDRYHLRPPYQQNDYIGWINRARRTTQEASYPDVR